MKAWLTYARPLLVAMATVVAVVACDEQLEGGLACPALCPEQPSALTQETLFAVEFDTTVGGFPPTGSEPQLVLAALGDTLDARAIVRFDTLPVTFRRANTVVDSAITSIDSARIVLRVAASDTLGPAVTIEVYDVDVATGDDTSAATLVPLFEPSRLIGSRTFTADSLKDALRIPIDPARLLAKITVDSTMARRLRVGLRITAASRAQLRISASGVVGAPILYFRASPDTSVPAFQIVPQSKTPSEAEIAADLADFQIIAQGPPAEPANVLRVGGIPGKRAYLRFNIPSRLLDSSAIVRAQLVLTQRPNVTGASAGDSGAVQTFAVSSSAVLTDLRRVLLFLTGGFDSTRVVPSSGDTRSFELIHIVRSWRGTTPERTPRAIALRSTTEGVQPWQVDFYSNEAPDALRPRLIVTYVQRQVPGIP